jgi:hypothetical protein
MKDLYKAAAIVAAVAAIVAGFERLSKLLK